MRLAEYKESGVEWIGRVPRRWEMKPAFSVLHELDESNDRGQIQNVLSLSYGKIVHRDVESNFGLLPESFNTYQIVRNGDIVLRLLDLQNDHVSLRVGLVPEEGIVTSAYLAVRPTNGLDSRFAAYLLHAYDLKKVFYSFGGGCRQSMGFEDLRRLPIPFPSPAEQEHIANYLDEATGKIDRLMSLRRRQMDLLREQRAALIQQAVTGGLNPHVPLKDSGLPWLGPIPKHWDEPIKLKYVSTLKGRLGWQGLKAEEYRDEGPYVVSSAHFDNYNILWDQCPRVSHERYELDSNIQLREGDLLLMKDGAALGKLAFVKTLPGPACLNSHLLLLRPIRIDGERTYDPQFLFCLIQTSLFQEQIRLSATGTTFFGVSQEAIGELRFALPPLAEQAEILAFIQRETAKLDGLHRSYERQLALLAEYRAALIHECVTGQRRVPN